INFAQGDLMMVGAYFGFTAVDLWGLPYWQGVIVAVAGTAVLGVVIERVLMRPMIGLPAFAIVMVTLGLGYLLRSLVTMVPGWGTDSHKLT
ncbi:hypothetical protein ACE4Z5_25935, partial [Salmonella enterica]|uniref:ABC transporter permease subunit n=1 Tax=Salmonella enterica TaxID=28901 RepID=UPI003D2A8D10